MSKFYEIKSTSGIYTAPDKPNNFNQNYSIIKAFMMGKFFAFIPFELIVITVLFLPVFGVVAIFNLFAFSWTIWILAFYLLTLGALAFVPIENMKLYKFLWYTFTFTQKKLDVDLPLKSEDNRFYIFDDQMLLALEVKQLEDFDDNARGKIEHMVRSFGTVKFIVSKEPIDEVKANLMTNEYMSNRKVLNNEMYELLRESTLETLIGLDMNHIYIVIKTPLDSSRNGYGLTANKLLESYNKIKKSYSDIEILTDVNIFKEII